jgi:hypothetical protein
LANFNGFLNIHVCYTCGRRYSGHLSPALLFFTPWKTSSPNILVTD